MARLGRNKRTYDRHTNFSPTESYSPSEPNENKEEKDKSVVGEPEKVEPDDLEHLTLMEQMCRRLETVLHNRKMAKPQVNIKEGPGRDDEDTTTPKKLGSKTDKAPPINSRNGFTRNTKVEN